MITKFIDAFPGEDKSTKRELEKLLHQLEAIPESFCGLVWLHEHDWLWMSKTIESVLGIPQEKFIKPHGLLFFQSLTPAHWVDHIYQMLHKHLNKMESNPLFIQAPLIARADAALLHSDGTEVPIAHSSAFIDYRTGHQNSYLILGCWLDKRDKESEDIERRRVTVEQLLLQIKDLYFRFYPERLALCLMRKKMTVRETEVLKFLAEGFSTKAISEKLNISFNTVETHRKNLLQKFKASNTAELISKASKVLDLR